MLVQACWLSTLLFTVSLNAHVFHTAGLKPRHLVSRTGTLPSTATPPYPTVGANNISISLSSTTITSHPTVSATETNISPPSTAISSYPTVSVNGPVISLPLTTTPPNPTVSATDTGILLLSTAPSPYPTVSASSTSVRTGSTYSASTILPSSVSLDATTPTAVPAPIPSTFYLVVANTGTSFDGEYILIAMDDSRSKLYLGLFGLKEPDPAGGSVFNLSTKGTLRQGVSGLVAGYSDLYGGFLFEYPDSLASLSESIATCVIDGGALDCQNQEAGVFYAFPQTVIAGGHTIPSVKLGPTVPTGGCQLTLLVVPT